MIIDTHAHVTGPMRIYEYFRGLSATTGPGTRPGKLTVSDDELEASLTPHLDEVSGVGTDVQILAPRPWAVPTGDRRQNIVMHITQEINDIVARSVQLHPDCF